MQQLGSSARTSNIPGVLAHLLRPLRREAQLSRRRSRDNAFTRYKYIGVGHGVPGWTENMTRRSLSGTMIALPRNSGSYNPRVGFDFRLSTKGYNTEEATPDEPKAANMPDATPGNYNPRVGFDYRY
ncbi:hypothetical protein E4U49_005605 [Claviceps purpurea]|nr:hypothetical protein E4U49_005605 [Claviceps purpurea]